MPSVVKDVLRSLLIVSKSEEFLVLESEPQLAACIIKSNTSKTKKHPLITLAGVYSYLVIFVFWWNTVLPICTLNSEQKWYVYH